MEFVASRVATVEMDITGIEELLTALYVTGSEMHTGEIIQNVVANVTVVSLNSESGR